MRNGLTIYRFLCLTALCCTVVMKSYSLDNENDTVLSIASNLNIEDKTNKKGIVGLANRIIRYFDKANAPHPEKALDISFIGGPHYSSEAKFGIGIVGSGLYYSKRDASGMPDLSTPVSNISLKLDVTTEQLYKIGAEGYHIFPSDQFRINYDAYFYSFKDKFWGIGYKNDINNNNESNFKRLQAQVRADFVFTLSSKLFIGPLTSFTYNKALRVGRPDLFDGQRLRTFSTGIGATVYIDTRDMPLNSYKGVYARVDQLFYPRFLANKYRFSQTEITLCGYETLWKGGVIAAMLHANLTWGNTPWGLMPSFGGSTNMRGYYEGRFRDKNEIDVTLELRQHVWRRNGFVVWVGAGNIFPRFSSFKWNHVLPNFGIGYRWQFKPRINIRLDYGIGKGKGNRGFNFSINEAF